MAEDISPVRSHHRFMMILLSSGDQPTSPRPAELDLVARVFARAGGSWQRVFSGSVRDVKLLKLLVKVAVSKGHITKSPSWVD